MTVFRRKDRGNAWWYEFERRTKRYSKACLDETGVPVTTKTAALEAETRAKAEAMQEHALQASGARAEGYTIGRPAAAYLTRKASRGASHRNNARLYVAEILAFFGAATPIAEIPDSRIDEYQAFAARQTLKKWAGGQLKRSEAADPADPALWVDSGKVRSKRTTNNYLKALRSIFAIAEKARDPVTRQPILDRVPEISLHKLPKRLPRPIPDAELDARLAVAPPWTIDAGELARRFSLRLTETLQLQIRHIDREAHGLRFAAGDTKSGNEEMAFGGKAGWQLLLRLERQALARKTKFLVTWPGPRHWQALMLGRVEAEDVPWQPLKHIRTSWRSSARTAGIEQPHRFHDVRARGITEVARVMPGAAQGSARHQSASTTAFYIGFASTEIADAVELASRRRPNSTTPAGPANAVRLVGIPVGTRAAKEAQKGLKQRRKTR